MSLDINISLTSVPSRLHLHNGESSAKKSLDTILNQICTYNYTIHYNIPKSYQNELVDLPEWLIEYQSKYDNLLVFRTEDYGPITKIIPTLERVNNPEAIIITVDDDLFYNDTLISHQIQSRGKYPNYAIGYAGMAALDQSCHFCTSIKSDIRVKLLEGYKGISYKRSFFDNDIYDFINKSWNDDIVLSAYMGYKNIPKIVIAYESEIDFSPRVESFPVIGHVPTERSGCSRFRNDQDRQDISEKNTQEFYKLGYLER